MRVAGDTKTKMSDASAFFATASLIFYIFNARFFLGLL
jgi:hypothetical protein